MNAETRVVSDDATRRRVDAADRAAHAIALEVLLDGPLPRSELARRLDLSAGSLTRLSKPLLDSGLLVEIDSGYDAASGRPTRPLDVDERSHHFVGVKLTADTALRRADHAAGLRRSPAAEAPLTDRTPAAVVSTVAGTGSLPRRAGRRPHARRRARRRVSASAGWSAPTGTCATPATSAGRRCRSARVAGARSWACRSSSTTTCCR